MQWAQVGQLPTGRARLRARIAPLAFLLALALANAVTFPSLVGFHSGKTLTTGSGALPYILLASLNAAGLFWLSQSASTRRRMPIAGLLLLALATRLAYLALRQATGAAQVDGDVALFLRYAQAVAGGQYPEMEYPQGALALFTLAYLPTTIGIGTYPLCFALLMIPCELVTLASIAWLGKLAGNEEAAWAVIAFAAISPFTFELGYGKFDAAPAAALALGMALFAADHRRLSALSLAAGFLLKWFPAIAIAFFVLHLLRARRWREALEYASFAALGIVLPLIPFWLASSARFLYTYRFHGSRPLMAESMLYVPIYLLEPAARLDEATKPWSSVATSLLSGEIAPLLQVVGIGAALVVAFVVRPRWQAAVSLSGVGVALFIVLNRVFSPQYILVLIAAYGCGLVALRSLRRLSPLAGPALLPMTLASYLVWPLWWRYWVWASAALLTLNLAICLALVFGATKEAAQTGRDEAGTKQAVPQAAPPDAIARPPAQRLASRDSPESETCPAAAR